MPPPRPSTEPNTSECADCGHEQHYHQGSGRIGNTTGCGVTYCRCTGFRS